MEERLKGAILVISYALLMALSPNYLYVLLVFLLSVLIVNEISRFTGFESFEVPISIVFSVIFFISFFTNSYLISVPLFFLSSFSYFVLVEGKLPEKFLEVTGFLSYVLMGTLAMSKLDKKLFIFLIAVVWSVDTLAYLTGKHFGKRKLVPEISPKKTVEGAVGGTIGGVIVSFLVGNYLGLIKFNLASALILIFITVISQFGDIFESYFKRIFNVKDSGTTIPGHGGVLDRLDSSLAVAPILFLLGNS